MAGTDAGVIVENGTGAADPGAGGVLIGSWVSGIIGLGATVTGLLIVIGLTTVTGTATGGGAGAVTVTGSRVGTGSDCPPPPKRPPPPPKRPPPRPLPERPGSLPAAQLPMFGEVGH